jgi:glycine/D-amino acid oxidase-like deaminating enzyme
VGLQAPLYFTHAEILETPPLEITLRTLMMPAEAQRFGLEAEATDCWQTLGQSLPESVLDAGVIQFLDRSVRMGQISYLQPDVEPRLKAAASEARLRAAIAPLLPALETVPGIWRHCLVSFSQDGLPLLGPLPTVQGLHLFSGFTSPFALLPPVAERFAAWVGGTPDTVIEQMQLARFGAATGAPP